MRLLPRAKDPDAEHRRLTQILAATWLIGHSDLHRRNLSFLHVEDGTPPSITIAPLYDVSSARGLKNIDPTLAIGLARQLGLTRLARIRPRVWIATWLIGHSDLHRRNLSFLHVEDGTPPSITIAPLYDVSSARGLKNIDPTLAIGLARQLGLTRIRPRVWIAHASECGLDPEETIEIVRATARGMPDAVAQARDEARSSDENKAQASVDRRVTEILRYAEARHRVFEQALAGMSRRSG